MLQNPYVLLRFFMVEVKTTRDPRQHRLHKIVTTLEREFRFQYFRTKKRRQSGPAIMNKTELALESGEDDVSHTRQNT